MLSLTSEQVTESAVSPPPLIKTGPIKLMLFHETPVPLGSTKAMFSDCQEVILAPLPIFLLKTHTFS